LIFGRLYSALTSRENIDQWLSQNERGGWIRVSDLFLLMPYFSYFLTLEKPHWMAATNINDDFSFFSLQSTYNLLLHFLRDDRPKHVFLCQSLNETSTKKRSVFIVPDSW
jgi:hypothetical protein